MHAKDESTTASSTVYTPSETTSPSVFQNKTPTDDGNNDKEDVHPITSSIPVPNTTFIISIRPPKLSSSPRQVITLIDGQVLLAPPGGRGSIHWQCVDRDGWYGFRNASSGRLLGHDGGTPSRLRCEAWSLNNWELFTIRPRLDGGYDLLMTHWLKLVPVTAKRFGQVDGLERVLDGRHSEVSWEFTKVHYEE